MTPGDLCGATWNEKQCRQSGIYFHRLALLVFILEYRFLQTQLFISTYSQVTSRLKEIHKMMLPIDGVILMNLEQAWTLDSQLIYWES